MSSQISVPADESSMQELTVMPGGANRTNSSDVHSIAYSKGSSSNR